MIKKYSVNKVLKMAEKYESMTKFANPLLLALPFLAPLVREHFIDTARGIKQSAEDLEKKFIELDQEASEATPNEGVNLYKSYIPFFNEFRGNVKKLSQYYDVMFNSNTSKEDKENAVINIDQILYNVSQQGATARVRLDSTKHTFLKPLEIAEDFGFTLGLHNSVRETQEAIDRLNIEVAKVIPEINKVKEEILKRKEDAPTATPTATPTPKGKTRATPATATTDEAEYQIGDLSWG